MATCAACEVDVEARFRFCPWCGAAQRRKVVEFFWPHAGHDDGVARAAVSLDEAEADRLAEFLERTACRLESESPTQAF